MFYCAIFILLFMQTTEAAWAETSRQHLNPVIAKLAQGEVVYGLITGDLSLYYAKEVARAPVDFVYVDMEHNPLDFTALHHFLMGLSDKAAIVKKGSLQPNLAVFGRFPTSADQSEWIIKQALDIGVHGIILCGVETGDQALAAVKRMRYPQLSNSKYYHPNGWRGAGARNAAWIWGISDEEYESHADLWPLNPEGDLFLIILIESLEALRHIDEIASTPGVGALFVGNGNDLARALGVTRADPQLEEAFQIVLASCKANMIACGISANTAEAIHKRFKEGWNIIRTSLPALEQARAKYTDF